MLSVTSLTPRAAQGLALGGFEMGYASRCAPPPLISMGNDTHTSGTHLDLRLDDGDGENQVAVVHDGLADARDGAGDAVVGRALAFLDLLGGLVHRAQHEVAAGRPGPRRRAVRNSSSGMPATEAPDQ